MIFHCDPNLPSRTIIWRILNLRYIRMLPHKVNFLRVLNDTNNSLKFSIISLKKSVSLYLNKHESPLPSDALCQVWNHLNRNTMILKTFTNIELCIFLLYCFLDFSRIIIFMHSDHYSLHLTSPSHCIRHYVNSHLLTRRVVNVCLTISGVLLDFTVYMSVGR